MVDRIQKIIYDGAEDKKKQSVPDEVNGDGYDDTKNTSTGAGAGVNGYDSVYGTGNVVFPDTMQGNNAYQQWLKNQGLDIQGDYARNVAKAQQAYAQALAQSRADYERQLGTYGAQAENLAQSGLSASGYSDYLAGQAYAQQQAANVQAGQWLSSQEQSALQSAQKTAQEQYANYLSQVNKQTSDIYSSLQSTGGKLSDEAKKYYETLGYSPEAITKAETLYSQYQATPEYMEAQAKGARSALLSGQTVADVTDSYNADAVNQAREDISKITDKMAEGVTRQSILTQLGYDTSSMSEEEQNKVLQNSLAMSGSNKGREAFIDSQIDFAKNKDDVWSKINYYSNIADVLNSWAEKGVPQNDISNLASKIANDLDIQIEYSAQDGLKMSYTAGKKRTERGHAKLNGIVVNTDKADRYLDEEWRNVANKLKELPNTAHVAVIDGSFYIRKEPGKNTWEQVSYIDDKAMVVLTILSKLQAAGYSMGAGHEISAVKGKGLAERDKVYTREKSTYYTK